MASKRFFEDSNEDPNKPNDKRIRPTRPSFASVIGERVMVKNLQSLLSGLEPLLRRVVNEEVDRAMRCRYPPSITRSPSLRIQASTQQTNFQLIFNKKLLLPVFTGSRLLDIDGKPIHVVLVDKTSDRQMAPTSLPQVIKLELVVLDGDFPHGDNESWMSEEFNSHIVKERIGKRPLLAGELNLTMRDGIALIEDLEFTDNSSWIRSRKFRVAVRVALESNQGVQIREGMTEAFVVKDHRGELYKKHHPPMLRDEVWRLEKIGKDGAFHRKLTSHGINTVQDFLKLSVVDRNKLKKILGIGMSEKMWEVTMKHAKTCIMGNKYYIFHGPHFTIVLNPICQMIRAEINGQVFHGRELNNTTNKSYIHKLVREAYATWNNLEEIDGVLNDNVALLNQHETMEQLLPNNHEAQVVAYDENEYLVEKSTMEVGNCEWPVNATFGTTTLVNQLDIDFNFSETHHDATITQGSSSSVFNGNPRWH